MPFHFTCECCGAEFTRRYRSLVVRFCSMACKVDGTSVPPMDRFLAKVTKTESCWLWTGNRTYRGYGRLWIRGRGNVNAHRVAYELLVGPIPDGLVIDHLCRNTLCVNPSHLEPVTDQVNILRGMTPSAVTIRSGRCKRGHELNAANLIFNGTKRQCRLCRNERQRQRTAQRKATVEAA